MRSLSLYCNIRPEEFEAAVQQILGLSNNVAADVSNTDQYGLDEEYNSDNREAFSIDSRTQHALDNAVQALLLVKQLNISEIQPTTHEINLDLFNIASSADSASKRLSIVIQRCKDGDFSSIGKDKSYIESYHKLKNAFVHLREAERLIHEFRKGK